MFTHSAARPRLPLLRRLGLGACLAVLTASQAAAGGLFLYEIGTEDVGLASAGYAARAQDASTVFTNVAGMTQLDGTQVTLGTQLLYGKLRFSVGPDTSPELGGGNGGKFFGFDGWFPGGGGFLSYSVSDDLKLGFAVTGNFGSVLDYGDIWAGRYYVKEATLVGASLLPSIAYRLNDKFSVGLSLNAMYGYLRETIAMNNVVGSDGQLKVDDENWGLGVNVGLMFEPQPGTRLGLTYNSPVDLDFSSATRFTGLSPGLETILGSRGLLNAQLDLGMTVPQQVMASAYSEMDSHWALLASFGWQDWSEFGYVEVGLDNNLNPVSLTANLDFKDTWHMAVGAQYRLNPAWRINFGLGYDSEFQDAEVAPTLPVNAAWRFGLGAQNQHSEKFSWGLATEYIYGGNLDVDDRSLIPAALGGRGDLVGSYNATGVLVLSANFNWMF